MKYFPDWESYNVVEKIGEGGMANVYKAFDPKLKRFVALKFLKIDSEEMKQRFAQEAQSQARLTHDNICQIYEVGEYQGTSYIAMQFISGQPLLKSISDLNVEKKVKIMVTIARAIHEAHRNGVIHRDIKPQNIFIEENADGTKTPYIMDFGLAKVVENPSSTISGTIIGTPNYMSPEQVYGEKDKIDRRSDVYCLGSTLYEVFTGKNCFDEDSPFKVLKKLVNHDFPSPRKMNPSIPLDIETIILKSMEKNPNRRYHSTKELADDLQRYLDGEPILARPASAGYRLVKKIKKHKAPVISGGIFLGIALFFLGMWIYSGIQKKRIAQLSQMFIQEIEQAENLDQISKTIPIHDTRDIKKQIIAKLKEIEERTKNIGRLAKGPGYYALGRGYRILGQPELALVNLENSWKNGYRNKNISYSFGVVLGSIYEQERDRILNFPVKSKKDQMLKTIDEKYRKPALRHLQESTGILGRSPDFIRGLIAYYNEDFEKADLYADQAFKQSPWLYDAKILKARILYTQAKEKINVGKSAEAVSLLKKAELVMEEVIKIGESDYRTYMLLCQILITTIDLHFYETGQDFYPILKKCLATLEKVEKIDPENALAFTYRGRLYSTSGEYLIDKGKDPTKDFEEGIKNCNRSIQINPEESEAYRTLGNIYIYNGYYLLYQERDPTTVLTRGRKILEKAIELDPNDASNYMSLGVIYAYLIQHQMNTKQDPGESISNSIKTFQKVISLQEDYYDAYVNLGGIYYLKADHEESTGINPIESINLSIDSHQKCMDIKPSAFARVNLGLTLNKLADYQIKTGIDPTSTLDRAEKVYREQIKVISRGFRGYNGLAEIFDYRAKWNFQNGKDPESFLHKSLEFYSKSAKINPKYTVTYLGLADVCFNLARFHAQKDHSPQKWFQRGFSHLSEGLKINPESKDVLLARLYGLTLKIRYLIQKKQSPTGLITEFNRISGPLKKKSSDYLYLKLEGVKKLMEGLWKRNTGQSSQSFFKEAENNLKASLTLNPRGSDTLLILSRVYYQQALGSRESVSRRTSRINAGLKTLDKALAINPNNAPAILLKGKTLLLLAGFDPTSSQGTALKSEGNQLRERALRINPYLKKSQLF